MKACALAALVLALLAGGAASAQRYRDPPGLVLGGDARSGPLTNAGGGWPDAVVLRRNDTGEAMRIATGRAAAFRLTRQGYPTELLVLDGQLRIGSLTLARGDYVYWPDGVAPTAAAASAGASWLLFRGPTPATARRPRAPIVVRDAAVPWKAGQVARAAGAPAPIEVKMYRLDPLTGARFSLIRMAPGGSVPWEIHATAEEGYLLSGDYHLAECLPSGRRDFDYAVGGYFYRPPSLLHSGPDSTTKSGATWLVRTPATLTAVFYPACPSAAGR